MDERGDELSHTKWHCSRNVSIAVVVQKLVPADAAGIMFTANSLTGARDQVVINVAWGLGEAIVSGLSDARYNHCGEIAKKNHRTAN